MGSLSPNIAAEIFLPNTGEKFIPSGWTP